MKFLFFIEREYHIGMLKPLWDYIFDNNQGDVAFFCPVLSKSIWNQHFRFSHTLDTIKRLKKEGLKYFDNPYKFNPDITFVADYNYFFVEGLGVIVNIGHGTISKGLYYLKNNLSKRENIADLICVPGTIHKEYLERVMYKPIHVTGMPKLDVAFKLLSNREESLKKYNLDPNKKTVLFAPTYNTELSLISFIKSDLRKYIPKKYNIIIKLHSLTLLKIAYKFRVFSKNDSNTYFAEDVNIGSFFSISDILVSDMSSVIYEYAAFKRPVIVFDHPMQREFINYNKSLLEYKYRKIGLLFTKLSNLKNIIEYAISNSDKIIKKQNSIANKFISVRDGSSSKKVLNATIKIKKTYKPEITVILHQNESDISDSLLNRIGIRSNIIIFTRKKQSRYKSYDLSSSLEEMFLIAKREFPKSAKILYLNVSFEFSFNMIDFITAHFNYYPETEIISPLISDENSNSNFTPVNFGLNIGYALTGESIKTPYINSKCFCINVNKFNKSTFSKYFNFKNEIKDNHYFFKELNSRLALDCLIYKTKSIETFGVNGPDKFPIHSIYLSFLYLNQKSIPTNFYKFVFNKIKAFKVNQTAQSRLIHFLEIASAYEKTNNIQKSKKYIISALKNQKMVKDKNVLGRLYYYVGLIEFKQNNFIKAKKYFKKCLSNIPHHNRAKEYLLSYSLSTKIKS